MLKKFKLGHDAIEAPKNICCVKGEGTFDHNRETRFKKFCLGCKNLVDQARLDRSRAVDFEATFQAIVANLVCSIWRVSGELAISQS